MSYDYDLMVIGAGSGGISSANLGMRLGKKVALVEKRKIGGDCTWYGCVPSKALIKASEVAYKVNHLTHYGLKTKSSVKLNSRQVMSHVRSVRERVYQEEKPEVFEKMGIDVYLEPASFVDNHTLKVGERTFTSKRFVIATGSSPFVPPIEGLDAVPYLTNETLFELNELPDSMVVLGGGPIGTEMASAFNRLGVEITLIEMADYILPREDRDMVDILMAQLQQEGLNILTKTKAVKVSQNGKKLTITVENGEAGTRQVDTDSILVSVGRKPNVDGLNLENAGVTFSKKGIQTDSTLRTTAKNIYACGDVIGSYQFSHVAEYHASVAVPNALLPLPIKRKVNYDNIVWATFTDPEFAHAGQSEQEARDKFGDNLNIYRFDYENVDRAKTDLTTIGVSKFICDKKNRLLGMSILGERAGELLHEAQLAKSLGVPFHKIQSMIHIYPTYGDVVKRPATAAYADKLQNHFFIKLIRSIKK